MKKFIIVGIGLVALIGGTGLMLAFAPNVMASIKQQIFGQDPDMPEILSRGKSGFTKEEFMRMRSENIAMYRGIEKDKPLPDPKDRVRAIETMERQEADLARNSFAPQMAWTEIGPNPIPNAQVETPPITTASGRTISIAVHPTNANIVYVGTAQGGLYRSLDGGTNWTRMSESFLSLAIGAIAISPSQPDTIYVGTGEPNFSNDSFFGVGVYRIDNASTGSPTVSGPFNKNGSNVDIMTGASVAGIAVHPTDPNTIFVATSFGLGGIGGQFPASIPPFGIYRSTNATGVSPSFAKLDIFAGNSVFLNISDIVIDPGNPNNVICVTGDAFAVATAAQRGIYQTSDALAATPTWTLRQALSTTDRTELAIARVGGVTTVFAASGLGAGQVWRSIDGGTTWTLRIANNFCSPQCFYDVAIDVDPTNLNRVYLGGSPQLVMGRSADGGGTFTADGVNFTAGLHVDTHAIAVAPSSPTTVYLGTDGGIYKTNDITATPIVWTSLNNSQFTATQFTGLAVHSTDVNFAIGGTQDNGTSNFRSDQTWNRVDFGDGGFAVIDQADTSTTNVDMYHTYFNNGSLSGYGYVSSTASAFDGNWAFRGCNGVAGNGIACSSTVLFYAPLEQGPGSPNNSIYFGSNILYRSANNGLNHTGVSQAFTSAISAIGISPQNDNVRVIGRSDGGIFGTTTGANPLVDMDPTNVVPNTFVSRVVIDPQNSNTAYVTLNNFGAINVWKTSTLSSFAGGDSPSAPTWTPAATGIPQIPVNGFMVDPIDSNRLYAGTDIGVYTSGDGGANWVPFGTGLPRVAVFDIAMTAGTTNTRRVKIATHGRGMWQAVPIGGPTAANAMVQGRLISRFGRGLANANVSIRNTSSGEVRNTRSGSLGYFNFQDLRVGDVYVVEISSKRYQFDPYTFTLNEDLTDLILRSQ
jgi:photosystem II stability/assembly factor-like uncharacterized protein